MSFLTRDVRHALRSLVRTPAFTVVAVLSLALGIGANAAIFSLANALFLNPLPVADASRYLKLYTTDENSPRVFDLSYLNWEDVRDSNDVFSDMLGYSWAPVSFATGEESEYLFTLLTSANYFDLLGVEPALGRTFRPGEDEGFGGHPVVVLSHHLWRTRFGGDRGVVGSTVRINNNPFEVVGVAPEGFRGTEVLFNADMWIPLSMHPQVMPAPPVPWFETRRALFFHGIGKLKPGVSAEEAARELEVRAANLEKEFPDDNRGRNLKAVPLPQAALNPNDRDNFRAGTLLLLSVVGLVFLLACTNVSTLLMARAIRNSRESAVRLAMGTGRGGLFRHFLAESLVLALGAGVVGGLCAYWLQSLPWNFQQPASLPSALPSGLSLEMDATSILFVLAISVLAGLLCGFLPALRASSPKQLSALREQTRVLSLSPQRSYVWSLPVVVQVVLSLVLLVGAGLFVRSLDAAQELDPGWDTERLLTVSFDLGLQGYDQAAGRQFLREAVATVEAIPGVESAVVAQAPPLRAAYWRRLFIEGQEGSPAGEPLLIPANMVGETYFRTTGIGRVRGRTFTSADREDSRKVAVINRTMAERYWPEANPVGQSFRFVHDGSVVEIVGVVADAKYRDLDEPPQPYIYLPWEQFYVADTSMVVRASGDPAELQSQVEAAFRSLDPGVPLFDVTTIDRRIHDALWAQRLAASLLSMIGLLALVLAAVGIYGVMSYSLAQRIQEIGVRMAFGATRKGILKMVLRRGMTPVVVGLVTGIALAIAAARLTRTLLFGIEPGDPLTLVGSALLLGIVALATILILSYRATRVDPVQALSYE